MNLGFSHTKNIAGALSIDFVNSLRRAFDVRFFVETGTFVGDTLAGVCNTFDRSYSVELSEKYHSLARSRFGENPRVHLINSDSETGLNRVLAELPDCRALFWLDAHFSGGDTSKGESNTPIESELRAILRYSARRDIILIDDLRCFCEAQAGFLQHETLTGYPLACDLVAILNAGNTKYDCYVLSDALLAIPSDLHQQYSVSPVLKAVTKSRLGVDPATLSEVEQLVSNAHGHELAAIMTIPEYLVNQSTYGLAGHYFYWRALVQLAAGDKVAAWKDAVLADRCGVIPTGSLLTHLLSGLKV